MVSVGLVQLTINEVITLNDVHIGIKLLDIEQKNNFIFRFILTTLAMLILSSKIALQVSFHFR